MSGSRSLRSASEGPSCSRVPADVERRILQAVGSLAYGSVEIVVHDSRVVQIERRERVRFERAARGAAREAEEKPTARRPVGERPAPT